MAGVRLDRRQLIAGATSAVTLPHSAVAAPLWRASGLDAILDEATTQDIRGLVILSGGQAVLSFGEPAAVDRIASCRKSFLSALYGIAIRDQKIDIDQTLAQVGIDDDTKLSDVERRATIRQLLQARSGIYIASSAETAAMKAARPRRGSHPLGPSGITTIGISMS